MEEDDYVETSDAEELEEIHIYRRLHQPLNRGHAEHIDGPSPRKRVKLTHDTQGPSLEHSVPRTPMRSSMCSPSGVSNSPASFHFRESPHKSGSMPLTPMGKSPKYHAQSYSPCNSQNAFENGSQDQLLLRSPEDFQKLPNVPTGLSRSPSPSAADFVRCSVPADSSDFEHGIPAASPQSSRYRSPSLDPLSLFGPPSSSSQQTSALDNRQNTEPMEDLSYSTPQKANTPHHPFSPLTPLPGSQRRSATVQDSPSHRRQLSNSPAPSHQSHSQLGQHGTPTRSHQPDSTDDQLPEIPPEAPRYALRERRLRQLQPYRMDQLEYKLALKSNPDAIVKFRGDRNYDRADDYAEEESQEQQTMDAHVADEGRSWEERRRRPTRHRSHSRSRSAGPSRRPHSGDEEMRAPVVFPEFLQDLPMTDEEEEQEMLDLAREAKAAERARKAKERETKEREAKEREAEEKLKAKKRLKRFPVTARPTSDDQSLAPKRKPTRRGSLMAQTRDNDTFQPRSPHRGSSEPPSLPGSQRMVRKRTPLFSSRAPSLVLASPALSPVQPLEPFFGQDDIDFGAVVSDQDYPELNHHDDPDQPNPKGDDQDGNNSDDNESDASDPTAANLDPKRLKALHRMMPAFMVKRIFNATESSQRPPGKRQRSASTLSGTDEEDGPLQPGQTRSRLSKRSTDVRDFRGDRESSDDEGKLPARRFTSRPESSSSDSDSVVKVVRHRRRTRPPDPDIIDLCGSDSHSESDDGVDDDDIQAYLHDEPGARRRKGGMTEPSLIDWMLTRTRTVGGARKDRKSNRSSRREQSGRSKGGVSKYKHTVVTGGVRRHGIERQTTLNFDRPPKEKPSGHRTHRGLRPLTTKTARVNNRADSDTDGYSHQTRRPVDDTMIPRVSKQTLRKQKEKERRARAKTQGVYTFNPDGTHVTTGRLSKKSVVTIDFAHEEFHLALAPLSQLSSEGRPRSNDRPFQDNDVANKWVVNRDPYSDVEEHDHLQAVELPQVTPEPHHHRNEISLDLRVPFLHSGLSFAPTTFIGKGWLHELLDVLSGVTAPLRPNFINIQGFALDPATGPSGFSVVIAAVCDGLIEFTTSLPEVDHDEKAKDWLIIMRLSCQLVSWFLTSDSEIDHIDWKDTVQKQVLRLITHFEGQPTVNLDETSFAACWFAIELLARLGLRPTLEESSEPLNQAVHLMVQHLINFGIEKTMTPVLEGQSLDDSILSRCTVGLWICLIHLSEFYSHSESEASGHLLWSLVRKQLQAHGSSVKANLEVSEVTWRTIFSLCSLAQFSRHGMTTTSCHISACWEIVAWALQRVRLVADATSEAGIPAALLDKRDEYVSLLVSRCFLLCDRWQWSLNHAYPVFMQILEIFRSRKFANLRHEPAEFPNFMHQNDWSSLFRGERGDTTFVLFWKLVVRAASAQGHGDAVKSKSQFRKLLSLAIPVGAFPFSKRNPPTLHDLSMLYNRLCAIAVAIYLDAKTFITRIPQARNYIDFSDADDTTRTAIIRGMMDFAIFMVNHKLDLKEITQWIESISTVLASEFKNLSSAINDSEPARVRGRLMISIHLLCTSVCRILEACVALAEYPEPSLLAGLAPILKLDFSNDPKTTEVLRRLIETICKARSAALPKPDRPRLAPAPDPNQESQDEYGSFDLDLDDPNLIAALGDDAHTTVSADLKARDALLSKTMQSTNLYWLSWRVLHTFAEHSPAFPFSSERLQQVDNWIYCWLSVAVIFIRNGRPQPLSSDFELFRNILGKLDNGIWSRRLHLSALLSVLRLDPMYYLVDGNHFIEVLMESLVSPQPTIEDQYFSWWLSIDNLHHPLFRDACHVERQDSGDFHVSPAEFVGLRLPLIQGMLKNLDEFLQEESQDNLSQVHNNQKYVGFCIKMISAQRDNLANLPSGSDDKALYLGRCREIFQIILQYPRVRVQLQDRLGFWVEWERSFT